MLAGAARLWRMEDAEPQGPARLVTAQDLAALDGPVVICGEPEGARPVPADPATSLGPATAVPGALAFAGLRQAAPPALSRGSEAALAGHLAAAPGFDGVILAVPPGAEETVWAQVSAREIVSFQSVLTPLLRRALDAPPPNTGFEAALEDTLSRPERLAAHLAADRAADAGNALAHLLGAELAAAKPYWLGQPVVLLAEPEEAGPYLRALAAQGVTATRAGFDAALLAGLWQAFAEARAR